VNRHHFEIEPELMQELVLGWNCPYIDVPDRAADLFGTKHARICDMPRALAS
jgi:hypothetical protein